MKKISKITRILAALTLVFALGACANGADTNDSNPQNQNVSEKIKAILEESIESTKVELNSIEGVYSFEFSGDYGLETLVGKEFTNETQLSSYLAATIPTWIQDSNNTISLSINLTGAGCTSIVTENAGSAGGKLFGRNFDYTNGSAVVIHTKPASGLGFESVSTSYPYFLSGERNWAPNGDPNHDPLLYGAIYVPMDGMNEKGLYVSILEAGDNEATAQNTTGKKDVQTTVAVRYLLDKADSVDNALTLLEGFNMHSVHNTAYHFALADNSGKSVVVEYINNEMKVEDAKVVTNHYIVSNSGKTAPDSTNDSLLRYNTAKEAGEATGWKMTPEQMRNTLKAAGAKQYDPEGKHISIWSAVYEPAAKKVTYYFREDYTKSVEVTFGN